MSGDEEIELSNPVTIYESIDDVKVYAQTDSSHELEGIYINEELKGETSPLSFTAELGEEYNIKVVFVEK